MVERMLYKHYGLWGHLRPLVEASAAAAVLVMFGGLFLYFHRCLCPQQHLPHGRIQAKCPGFRIHIYGVNF